MKASLKNFKVRYCDEHGTERSQLIVAPTAEKARQLFIDSYASPSLGVILEILDVTL